LRLHTVGLNERSQIIGKTIEALALAELAVDVTAVRRGKNRLQAENELALQAGDVIVLRGSAEGVARAEQRLLK
jgi:CPA2 family monovalent cation:H+ antiporter-2